MQCVLGQRQGTRWGQSVGAHSQALDKEGLVMRV